MASVMIGRTDCPECGFKGAHVKQSDKCKYRYCPECGSQHFARTDQQAANLAKKTRAVDATATASATGKPDETSAPAAPTSASAGTATATADTGTATATVHKRRGLFS